MKATRESFGVATLAVMLLLPNIAHATDASPWAEDTRSSMRLIAATPRNNDLRAGIEIKLAPGWHTYWRYPGDAGVPPRFEFTGSENVRSVKVEWPAPHAFTDETGTSIGYKDNVVFPLRVTPRVPGKPVVLHLKSDYAVCEKLCVPAEGRAELNLDGAGDTYGKELDAAEALVPKPVSASDAGLIARRVTSTLKPLVMLDIAAPKNAILQVFVEGPTAEWALPIPKGALGAPAGRRHYEFDLDGIPPGVNPMGPFELTFTIVGGDHPIEVTTHLD
jgi:DsbC/DsbD-like thiol-disulfide interchange protein